MIGHKILQIDKIYRVLHHFKKFMIDMVSLFCGNVAISVIPEVDSMVGYKDQPAFVIHFLFCCVC